MLPSSSIPSASPSSKCAYSAATISLSPLRHCIHLANIAATARCSFHACSISRPCHPRARDRRFNCGSADLLFDTSAAGTPGKQQRLLRRRGLMSIDVESTIIQPGRLCISLHFQGLYCQNSQVQASYCKRHGTQATCFQGTNTGFAIRQNH